MLLRRCGQSLRRLLLLRCGIWRRWPIRLRRHGLKVVTGDVVGDDTLFPWEPYAEDWAIDDAVWGYGAPVSAFLSMTIS